MKTNELSLITPLRQAEDDKATVNARGLHKFLGVRRVFSSWMLGRIREFGFIKDEDYISTRSGGNRKSGRPTEEYHLSLDMAKELAMVERTDKGKQARRYFIECEKKLQQGQQALTASNIDFGLLMNEFIKVLLANQNILPPGTLKLLSLIAPNNNYGEIAKNGLPKVGLARAHYKTVGRPKDAACAFRLTTQLEISLPGFTGGQLAL